MNEFTRVAFSMETPVTESSLLRLILLIILILAILGAAPLWPYSAGWGYGPTGGLGMILLVLLILILAGRL